MSLKKALGLINSFFTTQLVTKEHQIVEVISEDKFALSCYGADSYLDLYLPDIGLKSGGVMLPQFVSVVNLVAEGAGKYVNDYFSVGKIKVKLDEVRDLSDILPTFNFFNDIVLDLQLHGENIKPEEIDLLEFGQLLNVLSQFVEQGSSHSEVVFCDDFVFSYNSNSMFRQAVDFNLASVLSVNQLLLLKSFVDYAVSLSLGETESFKVLPYKEFLVCSIGSNTLIIRKQQEAKTPRASFDYIFDFNNQQDLISFDKEAFTEAFKALSLVSREETGGLLLLDKKKDSDQFYLKSKFDRLVLDEFDLQGVDYKVAVNVPIFAPCLNCLTEDALEVRAVWLPESDRTVQSFYFKDTHLNREIVVCCVAAEGFFNA